MKQISKTFWMLLVVLSLVAAACGSDDAASDGDSDGDSSDSSSEGGGSDLDELNVAYFLEWPLPNQFEQNNGAFDEELGLKVNWTSFSTGVEMSAAMASGDIDIAYSQGLVPFVNAVSAGQDIKIVDIAVSYAENDNCVAATDLGVDRDNAAELLDGAKVSVPLGTVAHYKMLKEMQYLGVDTDGFDIVNLDPAEGAAALQGGEVDMACGWGGGLNRMKEAGNIIMTGTEMEDEIGLKVFDVTSTRGDFLADHADVVSEFVRVTNEANRGWESDPDSRIAGIAAESGMSEEDANGSLATFSFPTIADQLGDKWFGGDVPTFMNQVADLFVAEGALESKLDDYGATIDTSILEGLN